MRYRIQLESRHLAPGTIGWATGCRRAKHEHCGNLPMGNAYHAADRNANMPACFYAPESSRDPFVSTVFGVPGLSARSGSGIANKEFTKAFIRMHGGSQTRV
jgi:hypothetical protein